MKTAVFMTQRGTFFLQWLSLGIILSCLILVPLQINEQLGASAAVFGAASHLYDKKSISVQVTDQRPPLPFPVHAFWHIANTGLETWRMVVNEQIQRIYQSRLIDSMNITAVFLDKDNSTMPEFHDPRITVEYGGTYDRFEFPTIKKLVAYCKQVPTGRVIYFHTKGASKSLDTAYGYNCYAWRRLMEHFTIDIHRSILLNELNDTSPYQVAGIHKKDDFLAEITGLRNAPGSTRAHRLVLGSLWRPIDGQLKAGLGAETAGSMR